MCRPAAAGEAATGLRTTVRALLLWSGRARRGCGRARPGFAKEKSAPPAVGRGALFRMVESGTGSDELAP
jgi:hypothetical protein